MSYAQRRRLPSRELDLMVLHPMPESYDIQCMSDGKVNLFRRTHRGFSRKFYKTGTDPVTGKDTSILIRQPTLELVRVFDSEEEYLAWVKKQL